MAMYLKVLGAGGNEFLQRNACPDIPYCIYADVTSCHFRRYTAREQGMSDAPWGEAHIWVREPVKTADVPGYCEVEKHVQLSGDAFLMNEQGRTISKFTNPSSLNAIADSADNAISFSTGAAGFTSGGKETEEEWTGRILRQLPYSSAKKIREALEGSGLSRDVLKIMDRERIAVG